jgi:ribose transport system substrate-binding protein
VDPVSASGENGAISKAIAAGIPVLAFSDGPVTSTQPYELEFRHADGEQAQAEYIAKRLHGKGNVLLIRGIAGTGGDNEFYKGMLAGLKPYPGIKIAATVYGNWSPSDSQSAVAKILPNLPKIDAIINEGSGEEYGAIQAFQAAGRPAPLTVGGDEGSFLQWWAKENKKNGYTTESATPNAGIGAAAVYVAYDIATGKKVPKSMNFPWLLITQKTLSKYAKTPFNGVAYKIPTPAWTEANVVKSAGPLLMSG